MQNLKFNNNLVLSVKYNGTELNELQYNGVAVWKKDTDIYILSGGNLYKTNINSDGSYTLSDNNIINNKFIYGTNTSSFNGYDLYYNWGDNYKLTCEVFFPSSFSVDTGFLNDGGPVRFSFYQNGYYFDFHYPTSTTSNTVSSSNKRTIVNSISELKKDNSTVYILSIKNTNVSFIEKTTGKIIYSKDITGNTGYSYYSGQYISPIEIASQRYIGNFKLYKDDVLVNNYYSIINSDSSISIYDSISKTKYDKLSTAGTILCKYIYDEKYYTVSDSEYVKSGTSYYEKLLEHNTDESLTGNYIKGNKLTTTLSDTYSTLTIDGVSHSVKYYTVTVNGKTINTDSYEDYGTGIQIYILSGENLYKTNINSDGSYTLNSADIDTNDYINTEDTIYYPYSSQQAEKAGTSYNVEYNWADGYRFEFDAIYLISSASDLGGFKSDENKSPIEWCYFQWGFYYDYHYPSSTTSNTVNSSDYDKRRLNYNTLNSYCDAKTVLHFVLTSSYDKVFKKSDGTSIFSQTDYNATGKTYYTGKYITNYQLSNGYAIDNIQVYDNNDNLLQSYRFRPSPTSGIYELYDSVSGTVIPYVGTLDSSKILNKAVTTESITIKVKYYTISDSEYVKSGTSYYEKLLEHNTDDSLTGNYLQGNILTTTLSDTYSNLTIDGVPHIVKYYTVTVNGKTINTDSYEDYGTGNQIYILSGENLYKTNINSDGVYILNSADIDTTDYINITNITVNLNGQWVASTQSRHSDTSVYAYYMSNSNYHVDNGTATMILTVKNLTSLTILYGSYAETTWDYVHLYALDSTSTEVATNKGKQSSSAPDQSYTYTLDGGTHTITIKYIKDQSNSIDEDRGYIGIKKSDIVNKEIKVKYYTISDSEYVKSGTSYYEKLLEHNTDESLTGNYIKGNKLTTTLSDTYSTLTIDGVSHSVKYYTVTVNGKTINTDSYEDYGVVTYTQLEYLMNMSDPTTNPSSSNRTAYIDFGKKFKSNSSIELIYMKKSSSWSYPRILQTGGCTITNEISISIEGLSYHFKWLGMTWAGSWSTAGSLSNNTKYDTIITNNSITTNGTVITSNTTTYSITESSGNIEVFHAHNTSNGTEDCGAWIYEMKYSESGTLINDWIPVIRGTDSVVCFFDIITKTYLLPTSGTLYAGPVKS